MTRLVMQKSNLHSELKSPLKVIISGLMTTHTSSPHLFLSATWCEHWGFSGEQMHQNHYRNLDQPDLKNIRYSISGFKMLTHRTLQYVAGPLYKMKVLPVQRFSIVLQHSQEHKMCQGPDIYIYTYTHTHTNTHYAAVPVFVHILNSKAKSKYSLSHQTASNQKC